MSYSPRTPLACIALALVPTPFSVASPATAGFALQEQETSYVWGRLVDEADGLPLPELVVYEMTAGWERASGKSNPMGKFTLAREDRGQFKVPPGELLLSFQDGDNWLSNADRRIMVPNEGDISVRIGPTFFLDLPSEVPIDSEALELAVFGPSDNEHRDLSRKNGTRIDLRTEHHDWVNEAPWVRLPDPLPGGAHWLRIRWGDPLLEARALLPRAAGRHEPRLQVDLTPMGSLDFTVEAGAIPRGQPFFLRRDEVGAKPIHAPYFPRAKGDRASVLSIESLRPGSYQWQLGFDGAFGSGVAVATGGKRTEVAIGARGAPHPAAQTVSIAIDTSLAPDLKLSQIYPGVGPDGHKVKVRPGQDDCRVRPHANGDGFVLEIDRLGPGRWRAGAFVDGPYKVLPNRVMIEDGVPTSSLRIVQLTPRTTIRVRCLLPEGKKHYGTVAVGFREGGRTFSAMNDEERRDDPITLEVPSTRPTTLILYAENYGLTRHRFDPSKDGSAIDVPVGTFAPYGHFFRFEDLEGQPIPGVSVDCGAIRIGLSDSEGHCWFDMPPKGPDGLYTVGVANQDLEMVSPLKSTFDLYEFMPPLMMGLPIRMRRRP